MKEFTFRPLPISRVSLQIEKEIREAILDCRLKSGDKLPTEKELSNQFGVSIVTLREALRSLEIFGLIQKKKGHGGGIFISDVSNESIKISLEHFLAFKDLVPQHLYEVRRMIEPRTIKLAASKISSNDLSRLEENLLYCEDRMSKGSGLFNEEDFYDVDQRNIEFHRLIVESTHNPILSLTVDYVLVFLSRYITSRLIPNFEFAVDSVQDHRKMLDCLRRKDEESCEKEMTLHLGRIEEYLMHVEKTSSSLGEAFDRKKESSSRERMRDRHILFQNAK